MSKVPQLDREVVKERKEEGINSTDRQRDLSKVRKSAVELFVPDKFREGQREAIEGIENAFKSGFRFVILDAPTGLGKSHVARPFAVQANNCHILTVQKILQDQYSKDFGREMFIMKGRGAYECLASKDREVIYCSKGLCRRRKDIRHENCPYITARIKAVQSRVVVHNFDSFYYQKASYGKRELLIIDEAHNIENKFLNFVSFTISNKGNSKMVVPEFSTVGQYNEFLGEQRALFDKRLRVLEELLDVAGFLTDEDLNEKDELSKLSDKIGIYLVAEVEYVFDYYDHETYQSVTFRPISVGNFVKNSLFLYGGKVLMMSATILDKDIFCRSIGIDSKEAKYIRVDSGFPAENRPIVRRYAGSVSYKNISDTLPKMVDFIETILSDHSNEKGIIHTVSKKVAKYIKDNSCSKRYTFRMDFYSVSKMLEEHEKKKGSFIVASGLKEGIDLKGDLSRVQIIAKIPFPNLGDKRVRRKKEIDPDWYGYMSTLMFIQSLGRSIRSKEDYAITYVLDSNFTLFYNINRRFIPKYITKAIVKKEGEYAKYRK